MISLVSDQDLQIEVDGIFSTITKNLDEDLKKYSEVFPVVFKTRKLKEILLSVGYRKNFTNGFGFRNTSSRWDSTVKILFESNLIIVKVWPPGDNSVDSIFHQEFINLSRFYTDFNFVEFERAVVKYFRYD